MKWLWLGKEYYTSVDNDDFVKVSQYLWKYDKWGYAVGSSPENKDILLHVFILGAKENHETDHINRAKWDNRKINLRFISKSDNQYNKGIPNNPPFPTEEEKLQAKEQREQLKTSRQQKCTSDKLDQGFGKYTATPVINDLGDIYPSQSQASLALGINKSHISSCCLEKRKTAGGRKWKFYLE